MSFISRLFDLVIGMTGLVFLGFLFYMTAWFICQMVGIDLDIYAQKLIEVAFEVYSKFCVLLQDTKLQLHEWVIKRKE